MFDQIAAEKSVVDYKDYSFLSTLDSKLHNIKTVYGSGSARGKTFYVDEYTEEKLTNDEVKGLLEIVNKNYFVFHPINTSMGFSVGYQITDPELKKPLLKFEDSQLPLEHTFYTLLPYFLKEENFTKAKSLGIDIRDYKSYYEY